MRKIFAILGLILAGSVCCHAQTLKINAGPFSVTVKVNKRVKVISLRCFDPAKPTIDKTDLDEGIIMACQVKLSRPALVGGFIVTPYAGTVDDPSLQVVMMPANPFIPEGQDTFTFTVVVN